MSCSAAARAPGYFNTKDIDSLEDEPDFYGEKTILGATDSVNAVRDSLLSLIPIALITAIFFFSYLYSLPPT